MIVELEQRVRKVGKKQESKKMAVKKPEPLLITGVFRAGTTLIAQMMNNHPDFAVLYDSVNFMRFSYQRYEPLVDFSNVEKMITEIHDRIKKRLGLGFNKKKVLEELKQIHKNKRKKITYSIVYDAIMSDLLLKKSGKKHWGEKTNLVWTKIPGFFEMFPKGRVIHIQRDPRAVIASWKKLTYAPGVNYLDGVFNCIDSMSSVKKYSKQFKNKRYISIRYEDLVTKKEQTLKKVCKKLEIRYSKDMLDESKFKTQKGKKWKGNSMFRKQIKGVTKSFTDVWKQKLSKEDIYIIQFFCGDLMEKFGYKKIKLKEDEELLATAREKIFSSNLVTDGALRWLFEKKGKERYPDDPIDPKNWVENRIKGYKR